MRIISLGLFFSKVLIVFGFLAIVFGTIGGIVIAAQQECVGESYYEVCTYDNVVYGLSSIFAVLVMSSTFIAIASYLHVRLSSAMVDFAVQALRGRDPSLSVEDARTLVESGDESVAKRFTE